jgi:hypothetical protein
MYVMAGLLLFGLFCNLLIRAVDPKHHSSTASQPGNA